MKVFIWISRHPLTEAQREALEIQGYDTIIEAGDADAFSPKALSTCLDEAHTGPVHAVGVVHPAAAILFKQSGYTVAIARNINRAPEGEPPQYEFGGWVFF